MVDSSTMECPRCGLELYRGASPELTMHACGTCGGVWLDNENTQVALGGLSLQARNLLRSVRASTSGHVVDTTPDIECPMCGNTLERVVRAGVTVDMCRGHGTWFDSDELAGLVAQVAPVAQRREEPEPRRVEVSTSPLRIVLSVVALAVGAAALLGRMGAFSGCGSSSSDGAAAPQAIIPGASSGASCSEDMRCAEGSDCLTISGDGSDENPYGAHGRCFHVCRGSPDCSGGQHCADLADGRFCVGTANIGDPCDELSVCADDADCMGLNFARVAAALQGEAYTGQQDDVLGATCLKRCSADAECPSGQRCLSTSNGTHCLEPPDGDGDAATADAAAPPTGHTRMPAHRRHPSERTPGR